MAVTDYTAVQLFPFVQPMQAAFTFQPILDGVAYSAVVPWVAFGERYYLTITTSQGVRVCTVAVTGSPNDYDHDLVGGYFTDVLVYRADQQQFEVLSGPVAT